MTIEFLTKYPGGHCSALAHDSGRTFSFLCSPDGSIRAINERLSSGKWHTLRPKQAAEWAAEIEQAVKHKMANGVS
jgi:hypothetical protein